MESATALKDTDYIVENDTQTISTQSSLNEQDRPLLADKTWQNSSVTFPRDKSTTEVKEDITCDAHESTTAGKKDVPCTESLPYSEALTFVQASPKQTKTRADNEDCSFFLPEGWIFLCKVRQDGFNKGKPDLYYYTKPGRRWTFGKNVLRSRQELQTYMKKNQLNYDPKKFFVKSIIPSLIKKGVLKYYDFRTIVSSDADSSFIANILARNRHKEKPLSQETSKCSSPVQSLDQIESVPHRTKISKEPPEPQLLMSQDRRTEPAPNTQAELQESENSSFLEMHGTERNILTSQNWNLKASFIHGTRDSDISTETGTNSFDDRACANSSENLENNNICPSKKRPWSHDRDIDRNVIKSLETDETSNKKMKIIAAPLIQQTVTFPNNAHDMEKSTTVNEDITCEANESTTAGKEDIPFLRKRGKPFKKRKNGPVSTQTCLKKRGRPSLADKIRQNKSVPLSNNADNVEKSITDGEEDVPCVDNESTTAGKEVIPCTENEHAPLIKIKTEEDSEVISFLIPEGWIFMGKVRPDGFIDRYFFTPPPRVRLRSKLELQAYLIKHKLDYDPTKFFVTPTTIKLLVKKGVLKKYDSRTIVSLNADETFIQFASKKSPWKHKHADMQMGPAFKKVQKRNSDTTSNSQAESQESEIGHRHQASSRKMSIKKRGRPFKKRQNSPISTRRFLRKRGKSLKKRKNGPVSTQTCLKKRGRPSLADKIQQNKSVPLSNNAHRSPQKSITDGEEDVPCVDNESTTAGTEVIPCTENEHASPIKIKTEEDSEGTGISFLLPEGWIFVGIVRQVGRYVGNIDIYYYTAPPRVKLRSRPELETYLNKHKLNYDLNKIYVKKTDVPLLVKKGVMKYYDSKTIVSSDADEEFLSQLSSMRMKTKAVSPEPATKSLAESIESVREDLEISSSSTVVKLPVKRGRPRKTVQSPPAPSKQESCSSFQQRVIIHSEPKVFQISDVFSSNVWERPKSSAGFIREKNSESDPPRSPFNLIQEDLFHDPWQMLIATIFLNNTSGRTAIPQAQEFLKRWPTPQKACQAKLYDVLDVIEPLGFGRTQAATIMRFSYEFLTKDWKEPSDLYGIGKYGTDSFKIFCMKNAWKKVESDDPMLIMYLNWRRATERLRKKFLNSRKSSKTVDPDESVFYPDKTCLGTI